MLLTVLTNVSIVTSSAHTDESINVDVDARASILTGRAHTGHPRL